MSDGRIPARLRSYLLILNKNDKQYHTIQACAKSGCLKSTRHVVDLRHTPEELAAVQQGAIVGEYTCT